MKKLRIVIKEYPKTPATTTFEVDSYDLLKVRVGGYQRKRDAYRGIRRFVNLFDANKVNVVITERKMG